MKASYVARTDIQTLLDPDSKAWRGVASETLALIGTPAGMQPTAAIRASWMDRHIGAVEKVDVQALHNGEILAFRLEWEDATENGSITDNDTFPDAAAIALPASEDAPLVVMGAPGAPVNAWFWRADQPDGAREVSAEGLGTSRPLRGSPVQARGAWKGGRWRVVIARALQVADSKGAAQLTPGTETGFGVAIWEGSNQERAGIKSFSGDWLPLSIDATQAEGSA
jgi:DMSO reductase family type II enzyme heme b subunit